MSERLYQKPCQFCKGSGYQGPFNFPDTPQLLRTIGCWPCTSCHGTGKEIEIIPMPPSGYLKEQGE